MEDGWGIIVIAIFVVVVEGSDEGVHDVSRGVVGHVGFGVVATSCVGLAKGGPELWSISRDFIGWG